MQPNSNQWLKINNDLNQCFENALKVEVPILNEGVFINDLVRGTKCNGCDYISDPQVQQYILDIVNVDQELCSHCMSKAASHFSICNHSWP